MAPFPVLAPDSVNAGMLTPRSKVAAMLADIDNASTPSPLRSISNILSAPQAQEHEETRLPSNAPICPERASPIPGNVPGLRTKRRGDYETGSYSSADDDSDLDVKLPRGRAARRMVREGSASLDGSQDCDEREDLQLHRSPGEGGDMDADDDLYSVTTQKPQANRRRIPSSPAASARSDGLFVSPAKSVGSNDGVDQLFANHLVNKQRLAELAAAKRAERVAKETEDSIERENRSISANVSSDLPDEVPEDYTAPPHPDIERIMSDAARPTRRASKKALLEMERETQRLARQQALAHQMKTRKKFTTNDLLARLNFRQPQQQQVSAEEIVEDTTGSSAPNSDGVEASGNEPVSTPPSSPPSTRPTPLERQASLVERGALSKIVPIRQDSLNSLVELESHEELPEIAEVAYDSQIEKGGAVASVIEDNTEAQEKPGLKLARFQKKAAIPRQDDSIDDDLDIIQPMPSHLRAFDNVKARPASKTVNSSKAIRTLKYLSHIGAYEVLRQQRKGTRPSIDANLLEARLRRKAKEHAHEQQLQRIEQLKAKGIDIQTAEEREREALVFEDLLDKARQDAVELRRMEKAALKAEIGDDGLAQGSDDGEEDEDDEDFVASGSEEDELEVNEEEREEYEGDLVDVHAQQSDDEEEDGNHDVFSDKDADTEADAVDDNESPKRADDHDNHAAPSEGNRKSRPVRIVRDDDDDADDETEQTCEHNVVAPPQQTPKQSLDPFAAFGFSADNSNASLMSPTQAFQATMQTPSQATQEESIDILKRIAPQSASRLPSTFERTHDESHSSDVSGSQVHEVHPTSLDWEANAPTTPVPGLNRGASALNETPEWEPTQDPGLPSPWTNGLWGKNAFDSHSKDHETQSTVRLRISESPAPSNAPVRRGRLVRRQAPLVESDEERDNASPGSRKPSKGDAFREMARRRAAALTAAEREVAEKEMKEMMDEQAEESEDEYAGLGGDDFVAPETEEDKAMIDSGHVEVDERALAAHFAERERIRQEQETSKLYKDLTTGALRRKQANMFDLDEDEDEVAIRRRQTRQREEARKRRLLLQDDNIAGLAEGKQSKGKDAFLKAIADDDDGEDVLDLSDSGEQESAVVTQEDSQQPSQQPGSSTALSKISGNKRPFVETDIGHQDRPPAKERRTQMSAFRRPTSMLEVKESVSFLLEEPSTATFGSMAMDADSDADNEHEKGEYSGSESEENDENERAEKARRNDGGFAPNQAAFDAKAMPPPRLPASQRRTAAKSAVVDRLSLKRGSSTSDGIFGRTAWAANPAAGDFKAPPLLRRAATIMTTGGANDRGVSSPALSRENSSSGVKMGGTKKSSLAYQARAEERKAIIEASAKRRAENTARIAQMRRNSSLLSGSLTGRFE